MARVEEEGTWAELSEKWERDQLGRTSRERRLLMGFSLTNGRHV